MIIHQEEILQEILSRLPAKTIGRFRTVSKSWKSLLSQPQFIKTHLNRIKQNPFQEQSLILQSDESNSLYTAPLKYAHQLFNEMTTFATKLDYEGYTFVSKAFLDKAASWGKFLAINAENGMFSLINVTTRESKKLSSTRTFLSSMASCDGLVVVKGIVGKVLLINPTTRELEEVPDSPYAINPGYSNTMFGIGYDSLLDDYKVVTISYYNKNYSYYVKSDESDNPDNTEMLASVYSVRNGTWKRAASSPYNHSFGSVTPGVFVNGCIHWLAGRKSGLLSSVIMAFDVEQEVYHEVPPPSSIDHDKFVFNRLAALGGCLCLFCFTLSSETDIWVMKEYGVEESWTKFAIIDSERSEYRPLCLLGTEIVVLVKFEEYGRAKLLVYDKEEGKSKDVEIEGIPDGFGFGETFLESLVSPHCNND